MIMKEITDEYKRCNTCKGRLHITAWKRKKSWYTRFYPFSTLFYAFAPKPIACILECQACGRVYEDDVV